MALTLSEIKAELARLDVRPTKARGQNFLFESGSIRQILHFIDLPEDCGSVLEIGPGLGAITESLLASAKNYFAVEIEARFRDRLLEVYPQMQPENILQKDIRQVKLAQDLPQLEKPALLVGNIPYSISSEVTLWALEEFSSFNRAVFLMQREFAERLAAKSGTKDYGSLSVLLALHAKARLGPIIPGHCFFPSAKVESRLISLDFYKQLALPGVQVKHFEKIVRACFSTRRKQLKNSLLASGLGFSKEQVSSALAEAQISEDLRAEVLELEQFAALSEAFARQQLISD